MSLLKHPSVAMTRLMESVERGSLHRPSGNGLGDRTLQRPVISFVMQRHDLESLQIAMRHSLRKAACRVYALQVSILLASLESGSSLKHYSSTPHPGFQLAAA